MEIEEAIEIVENDLDMFINDLLDNYRQSKVKPFEKAVIKLLEFAKKGE